MTDVRRSFLALFGVALVVAVVGRIGLAVMDLAGVLTYDYICLLYTSKQVVLFGSYARGEAGAESDIDLRILCDGDRRFSIMNLAAFGNRIEQATGKSVDIVSKRVIDNDELREAIKLSLIHL